MMTSYLSQMLYILHAWIDVDAMFYFVINNYKQSDVYIVCDQHTKGHLLTAMLGLYK